MTDQFTLSWVRSLPLFAYLSPSHVEAVAGAFQQLKYLPGDRLYRQGDTTQALYVFVSGAAQLLRSGPGGVEYDAGHLQAGESLGETSLFQAEPHAYGVLITQESLVLVLTRARFDAVLSAHPDIRPLLNIRKDLMDSLQTQRQRRVRPDEAAILLTRRHPWTLAAHALVAVVVFAVLAGGALASTLLNLAFLPLVLLALSILIPACLIVYAALDWYYDTFVLTSQRVIHEQRRLLTGREQRDQALLTSIQNVAVSRRGLFPELINFGDVNVYTIGNQHVLVLDNIPTPLKVQQAIFNQIQRRKDQMAGPEAIRAEVDALLNPQAQSALSSDRKSGSAPGSAPARDPLTRFFQRVLPPPRMDEGDQIIYHKHWLVLFGHLWKPAFGYILLGVLLGVKLSGRVAFMRQIPGLIVVGIALVWLLLDTLWMYWGYANWHEDLFIITSQSIIDIIRTPLLLRETRVQANLNQIQNVTNVIKNAWGKLFNVGDVVIQTAAENSNMVFENVQNPSDVAEEVLRHVQHFNERQTSANQQEQRRIVAEYLSAYHQAQQRDSGVTGDQEQTPPHRANLNPTQTYPPPANTYPNQPPRPPNTPE